MVWFIPLSYGETRPDSVLLKLNKTFVSPYHPCDSVDPRSRMDLFPVVDGGYTVRFAIFAEDD